MFCMVWQELKTNCKENRGGHRVSLKVISEVGKKHIVDQKCIKRESNPRRVEFYTRMATTQVTTTPLMPTTLVHIRPL